MEIIVPVNCAIRTR